MTTASSRPREIRALAGARAIPPLLLVLFHFCEGHGYRNAKWFDLPVGKGYLWVEFFFALSGFILIYVYGARWRHGDYLAFLKARLARLYPLHLFMLLAVLAMVIGLRALAHWGGYVSIYDQPYHPIDTWPSFIANLFLVQAWNIFPTLTWNGASWFVSVLFLLCLLFPVYVWISRRGGAANVALIAAGLAVLTYMSLTSRHGLDITFHNGIYRGMAGFAVGVGIAGVYEALRERAAKLPDWIFSLAQLAAVLWLLYGIYDTGWAHRHADILTVLPMMALVFVLCFDRGIVAAFFATRPLIRLGEWSYAIYMGQTVWLELIRVFEQRVYPPPDTLVFGMRWADAIWWPEPLALLAVCILWGALLTRLVERPANAALRRFFAPRHVAS